MPSGVSPCFLAEWYVPRAGDVTISEVVDSLRRSVARAVRPPELLYALEVSTEAYMFGVFSADSADAVAELCRHAGHPADRVSAAAKAEPRPRTASMQKRR